MWNLPKGNMFLYKVQVNKLQSMHEREKNPKAKLRLLAAIERKKGKTVDNIACFINKPKRTVHGWLQRIDQHGLETIYDKKQTGRPTQLTGKELNQLKKDLIKGPKKCGYAFHQLWTRRLIEDLLRSKYKVSFTDRHVRRMLNDAGFSFIKPRRKHYKSADKRSQERFKKTLGRESDIGKIKNTQYFAWTRAR